MSRRVYINVGSELIFDDGSFLVTSKNDSGVVYGEFTTYDYDGSEVLEVITERRLTLREIALELSRSDGHNHIVCWG